MDSAWSFRSSRVLFCGLIVTVLLPSRCLGVGPVDIDLALPLFSINCWVFIPRSSIAGRRSLKNRSESSMPSLTLLFSHESSIFSLFLNGLRNCPSTFSYCLSILKLFVFDTQFEIEVALLPVLKSLKLLLPPWFGATKMPSPCFRPHGEGIDINFSRATWLLAKLALAFSRPSAPPPLRISVSDTVDG